MLRTLFANECARFLTHPSFSPPPVILTGAERQSAARWGPGPPVSSRASVHLEPRDPTWFPLGPITPCGHRWGGRGAEIWLHLPERFTHHGELFSDLRPSFRYAMKTETWFWVSSPNSHRASRDGTCEVAGTGSAEARPWVLFLAPPPTCVA